MYIRLCYSLDVSTHSRLKAAGKSRTYVRILLWVSTHSRLKAAGTIQDLSRIYPGSFNTQPPEGGWLRYSRAR